MTLIQRGIAMIDITRGVLTADRYPELRSEWVEDYLLSTLSFCVHTGTHVDAPLHYLPDGQSADQLNVESLSGRCLLVEKEPNDSELTLMKRRKIEILLLKSGSVTLELLSRLQKLGLKVVGNDLLSIAPPEERGKFMRLCSGEGYSLWNASIWTGYRRGFIICLHFPC